MGGGVTGAETHDHAGLDELDGSLGGRPPSLCDFGTHGIDRTVDRARDPRYLLEMGDDPFDLRDPAGLVARVPELRALAARSPSLRKAIERGRPLAVHRALWWLRFRGGSSADRPLIKSLLANRRLFVATMKGAPPLTTINGVGTTVYGSADPDPRDGSYVTTLYLVFFFVPIYPIGSYLVRDNPQSRRRGWFFHAKVPLGFAAYVWQRLTALIIVAAVLAGVASTFVAATHADLVVVNGLPRAVTARLDDGAPVTVAAAGRASIRTGTGKHVITIDVDGRVVEKEPLDVPSRHDVVAWNILGAAPIYAQTIVYSPEGKDGTSNEPPRPGCGLELFTERDVSYAFVEPPRQISADSKAGAIHKRAVGVATGGPELCLGYLYAQDKIGEAGRLATGVARALDFDAKSMRTAVSFLMTTEDAATAQGLIGEALVRHPDDLELHRLRQDTLKAAGKGDELVAEYKARLDRDPESADAAYLHARLLHGAAARTLLDSLAAKFPDHAPIIRACAYEHVRAGDYAGAVTIFARLRKLDENAWRDVAVNHVETLVGARRAGEAATLLGELLRRDDLSWNEKRSFRADRLRVAKLQAGGSPAAVLAELPKPADAQDAASLDAYARLDAGLSITDADLASALKGPSLEAARLELAARSDPAAALQHAGEAAPATLKAMDHEAALLLFLEAAREPATQAIRDKLALALLRPLRDTSLAYLRDGGEDKLDDLLPSACTIVHFVRSRMTSLPAAERKKLLALARTEDVLHGPTTVAMDTWPK